MARVIAFRVLQDFKSTAQCVPPGQRGEIVEFPSTAAKVSLNGRGAKDEVRSSQAGGGAAC